MTDLRTLALAATPGPWRQSKGTVVWAQRTDDSVDWSGLAVAYTVESEMHPKGARKANAAYIAAASPAVVLALLDVVEAARGLVDVVEPADIPTLSREQLNAFLALRAALAAWQEATDGR